MNEDQAIKEAGRRIVFPLDDAGFRTCYVKMLKAFRRTRRHDTRHGRRLFLNESRVGRKNRCINHRWKAYSRRFRDAIRVITRGKFVSWSSGCGRLEVSMPEDSVHAIGGGGYAAFPIYKASSRIVVFFATPKAGARAELKSELAALIRNELRGYGAWEDHELADDGVNLVRLVWLAGCHLHDEYL